MPSAPPSRRVLSAVRRIGLMTALVAPAAAQASRPTLSVAVNAPLRVLVLRSSGKALEGAHVTLFSGPRHGLPWHELDEVDPIQPATATTDIRGEALVACDQPGGTLLVEHESGLGAVRFDVQANSLVRVDVEPCAELRPALEPGATPPRQLELALALQVPGGGLVPIGKRVGPTLVLPAGRWHYLGNCGGRLCDGLVALLPAQRLAITPPDPSTELKVLLPVEANSKVRSFAVRLGDWPMDLPVEADGGVRIPGGRDLRRALVIERRERVTLFDQIWLDASSSRPLHYVPPRVDILPITLQGNGLEPLVGALVLGMRRVGERATPRSLARSDAAGSAFLARPPGREATSYCVIAPGRAFAAIALEADAASDLVQLGPEHQVLVRTLIRGGAPAPGMRFQVRPSDAPWFVRHLVTGPHGETILGGLGVGETAFELEEPGYVRQTELHHFVAGPLPSAEPARITLEAEPGALVQGRVISPENIPLRGANVTLRDTTGLTGVRERHVATDGEGRFRFDGLPDHHYTLSASLEVAGRTISGQLHGVQPGDNEWSIVVRSEDPLPPGRKDQR